MRLHCDWLSLSPPAGRFHFKATGDKCVTMVTAVEIKVAVGDLMPITLNQRLLAFGAVGALSRDVMHVAEVNVVQTSLHSGFVGELQDLVRCCWNIPHLEVRMKGSEVNANITPDFREYPIDNAFQLSGSSFAPESLGWSIRSSSLPGGPHIESYQEQVADGRR